MSRVIFHVDVNSAFLSWTAVHRLSENPASLDLRTVPSAVGGDVSKRHGVITARSIPAKKYGVKTGEPVVSALRKCPGLILVPSDFAVYREYSRKFIALLHRYSDEVEQVSIDEAYVDMTQAMDRIRRNSGNAAGLHQTYSEVHSPAEGFFAGGYDSAAPRGESEEGRTGPFGAHGKPGESIASSSVGIFNGVPSAGDGTGQDRNYAEPVRTAVRLADEVWDTLGFSVNVGISENKLLAKMASDFRKPGRVHTLWPEEITDKLWPLDIGELYGCGRKTAERLKSAGIRTIGDAAAADPDMLCSLLGEKAGIYIASSANGISESPVSSTEEEAKSYSNETTTGSDITATNFDRDGLPVIRRLAESVAGRLARDHVFAGTVEVSVKSDEFHRYSRQTKLPQSTNDARVLSETAEKLCRQLLFGEDGLFSRGRTVRLIGVGTANLDDGSWRQMDLFSFLGQTAPAAEDSHAENVHTPEGGAEEASVGKEPIDRNALNDLKPVRTEECIEGRTEPAAAAEQETGDQQETADQNERSRRLSEMMDKIRAKYGENAVHRGT